MGLKSFLVQQGFISEEHDKAKDPSVTKDSSDSQSQTPSYFPINEDKEVKKNTSEIGDSPDPSFVTPLHDTQIGNGQPDANFVKFFENELLKANLAGPDYFEFRQLLIKTQQKMASKGGSAPEVVLQAVLMSFEAQEITPAKLIEAAQHYKDILKQKNDDFIKGAETEKNNQLQKRQAVLRAHDDAIHKIQLELEQLESRKQVLNESIAKEKTQNDVDKTLGKEGIEKIEKAERLITLAHEFIQTSIDADIKRLQSV